RSRVQIRQFSFGDLLDLLSTDLADLVAVRLGRSLVYARSFLQKVGCRRRLGDECKGPIGINRDHHRNVHVSHIGGLGVERLAAVHDVNAVSSEGWDNWRCRVCLSGGNLQLYVRLYFLCHIVGSVASQRAPALLKLSPFYKSRFGCYSSSVNVSFSTSRKFNSTGVERPKIVTITFSTPLSGFISST